MSGNRLTSLAGIEAAKESDQLYSSSKSDSELKYLWNSIIFEGIEFKRQCLEEFGRCESI